MSPEQFSDALNYLDDDLIEQTDDLRQGRRVLRTASTFRQVLRWAAPAACLVLILGIGSRILPTVETNDTASQAMEGMEGIVYSQNGAPAEAAQSGSTAANEEKQYEVPVPTGWQQVSAGGVSLSIPADWEYELEPGEDGSLMIAVRPAGELGELKIGYMPSFGVCGTGLTEKETTIAGLQALAGYYDNSSRWSFITFPGTDYVIRKDGADAWWSAHAETVEQILETIVIAD